MKAMSCSSGLMSECFISLSVAIISLHQVYVLYASLAPPPPFGLIHCPSNLRLHMCKDRDLQMSSPHLTVKHAAAFQPVEVEVALWCTYTYQGHVLGSGPPF